MPTILYTIILAVVFYFFVYHFSSGKNKYFKWFYFLSVSSFSILCLLYILSFYYTSGGIDDAAIYHLRYGNQGAGIREKIITYIQGYGSIAAGLVIGYLFTKRYKTNKFLSFKKDFTISILLGFFVFSHPFFQDLLKLSSIFAVDKVNKEFLFNDYYKIPTLSENRDSKNILYIYMESFERSYFDEKVFPGLITELRKIEDESISFTNMQEGYATSWTIAGMVGSQCGIPLVTPLGGNSMSGMDYFLSGAKCLGDFLKKSNYFLTYMGGSDLEFAGKGKFYSTHSFDEVLGKKYFEGQLEDKSYQSSWGLYDDTMIDHLYDKYIELSEKKEKFGLFFLTLDTHFPDGHIPAKCSEIKYQDGENELLNAIKCSDYLVGEFIEKVKQTPYYDDTLIVITSDHLSPPNGAKKLLEQTERKNMFMIHSKDINPQKIDKLAGTIDKAPTLLDALGFNTSTLGLGVSLFRNDLTIKEKFDIPRDILTSWRDDISKFWDYPSGFSDVYISLEDRLLKIREREFQFPLLMEFKDDGELKDIKFDFNLPEFEKLKVVFSEMDGDKSVLWVDKCINMGNTGSYVGDDFCYYLGQKKNFSRIMLIDKSFNLELKNG